MNLTKFISDCQKKLPENSKFLIGIGNGKVILQAEISVGKLDITNIDESYFKESGGCVPEYGGTAFFRQELNHSEFSKEAVYKFIKEVKKKLA